jgi:hypothetical protein
MKIIRDSRGSIGRGHPKTLGLPVLDRRLELNG